MQLIYKAMGWMMRSLYDFVMSVNPNDTHLISNYTIALILLSVIIKLITIPLGIKQSESMAKNKALQPKVQELYKKYGNDEMTIARKQQELYKEAGISPMGGCLPMLIQFPILIAMFRIVQQPTTYIFPESGMYESINKAFLWMDNINSVDTTMLMPIIAGVAMLLYQHFMVPEQAPQGTKEQQEAMESSQRMMKFMMPAMMIFIYRNLPAALPLYMTINNFVTAIQQTIVNRLIKKEVDEE